MKIGNINIDNNVFLAPMAGITDVVFRKICRKWGCGPVYSEMVSAKGLYYKDKKTKTLLEGDDKSPYIVQIFGSDPKIIASTCAEAASYGDILDINMGCPAPKIVNNGDGSALLKNPDLAFSVAEAAVKNAGVPVTVKIRIGWDRDNINAVKIAKGLENCGVSAIAVHGRTRMEFYSGKADRDIIREVKNSVKIPVIANGDIFSAEDALSMLSDTGCDGVMIGRGAQGNPFIFRQISELFALGRVLYTPTPKDKLTQATEHITSLVSLYGEDRGVKEARKHIAWYLKGLENSSSLKNQIFTMTNLEQIKNTLCDFMQQYQ